MNTANRLDPFNNLVEDLFKGFVVKPMYEPRGSAQRMKVDVVEKNGAYVVAAELPGVKREDIQIAIDGAQVTLSAEVKRDVQPTREQRVLHLERQFGTMSRTFSLPQEFDEARAEAKLRDGVLELVLPKKQAAQRQNIPIQ